MCSLCKWGNIECHSQAGCYLWGDCHIRGLVLFEISLYISLLILIYAYLYSIFFFLHPSCKSLTRSLSQLINTLSYLSPLWFLFIPLPIKINGLNLNLSPHNISTLPPPPPCFLCVYPSFYHTLVFLIFSHLVSLFSSISWSCMLCFYFSLSLCIYTSKSMLLYLSLFLISRLANLCTFKFLSFLLPFPLVYLSPSYMLYFYFLSPPPLCIYIQSDASLSLLIPLSLPLIPDLCTVKFLSFSPALFFCISLSLPPLYLFPFSSVAFLLSC